METYTGKFIDPANVDPCMVDLVDIAHQLARIFRFSGATESSVAEHAVDTAWLARECGESLEVQYACLHHDSHEYIFGDMTHDIKALCPDFKVIEKRGQDVVMNALGVIWTPEIQDVVRKYDRWGGYIEAVNYLPSKGRHWSNKAPPDMIYVMDKLPPSKAESLFLQTHEYLWGMLP